jgi:hypothetical protein
MTISICPITQEPIKDPVFAPDFYTYERSALEQWLRTNPTSPMTRQPMRLEDLKKKVVHEDPIPCEEDSTTPLLGSPITIITTTVNTVTGQVQTHRQAQQQKMIMFVCPVVIGVIILIFLIRTIS